MLSIEQIKKQNLPPYNLLIFGSPILLFSFNVRADHKLVPGSDGELVPGYDTVACFTMGKAVKESKDIVIEWLPTAIILSMMMWGTFSQLASFLHFWN